jgi:UDP-N-acetylglucosamine--N-acetylmuramyl-(pentapeptide) pyrophosphoryl-undecaprenol N-acetylglucosamine transferase
VEEIGRFRIWIAGGGTGGHLFPALAVADELKSRHAQAEIAFVGARRGIETRLVPRAGYPLRTLPLSGLKGASLRSRVRATAAAGVAVARCAGWMLARRPDVVIGVGGYASGPAVLAARALRVKTMILEQNHFPGATNRWLAPRVDVVCVPSEDARRRFGNLGVITGNPVRESFSRIGEPPMGEVPSVLVFGGSRGARTINRAVVEALPRLAAGPCPPRIVHQTGTDEEESVRESYEACYPVDRFEVLPFLDDMPERLAAADLVLCRAGAMTLAELAAAGRAAVLVPYPFAADDHQRHNAEAVASAGGAEVILDAELDGERVASAIERLTAEPETLRKMGRAARTLAVPDATERIADQVDGLLAGRGRHVS